ncbi:MAG: exodeoxyribonuclease VII small subunit [Sphingobium sp.]
MTGPQDQSSAAALDGLSFEDALRELEMIVQKLERGDVPLDDSIALYARGEMLRAQCQKRLADAEARIEKLTVDAAGTPVGAQNFSAG